MKTVENGMREIMDATGGYLPIGKSSENETEFFYPSTSYQVDGGILLWEGGFQVGDGPIRTAQVSFELYDVEENEIDTGIGNALDVTLEGEEGWKTKGFQSLV